MNRRSTAPRPITVEVAYQVDDLVQVGGTRWIIRHLDGDQVVLEASSAPAGIVWTTTLDNLPTRMKETTP
ncbi:hypothetical protein WDU99_01750 [Microbacterium sp. Mu-80]|uniref:Uncharacterized protein n=1 Tax=Microbacterium bandirmense TaxID=3122050 RepID=A0ABU8L6T5_9MICO